MSLFPTWDSVNRASLVQVSSGNHDGQFMVGTVVSNLDGILKPRTPSSGSYTPPPPPLAQWPLTFTGEWYKCYWFSPVPPLFSLLPNKPHAVSSTKHLLGYFLEIITKCKVTCFINSCLPIICKHFVSVAHVNRAISFNPLGPCDSALDSPSSVPNSLVFFAWVYFLQSCNTC